MWCIKSTNTGSYYVLIFTCSLMLPPELESTGFAKPQTLNAKLRIRGVLIFGLVDLKKLINESFKFLYRLRLWSRLGWRSLGVLILTAAPRMKMMRVSRAEKGVGGMSRLLSGIKSPAEHRLLRAPSTTTHPSMMARTMTDNLRWLSRRITHTWTKKSGDVSRSLNLSRCVI